MHPIVMHEIARYRQADLLREAERARLAHLVAGAREEERRTLRPRRRTRLAFRPAVDA